MPTQVIAKQPIQPSIKSVPHIPKVNRQRPGTRPLATPQFNKNRPIKKPKPAVHKTSAPLHRATKPKNRVATMKWWNSLSHKDQVVYIRNHPKTTLKLSRLPRPRLAKNQRLGGGNPKINNKHATVHQGAAPAKTTRKFTLHHRFLHKLFGHAHKIFSSDDRTNKLINRVEHGLSKRDHELLDQAKTFAQKHPELEKPPHYLRKALINVMAYTLLATAGAAVAGPAGVLLVTHTINEWKNHGGGMDKLAWNALRGRKLDGEEEEHADKTERPVNILIKSLRFQLQESKNEADKERIRDLIETLEEQVENYHENKQQGLPTAFPGNVGGHKSRKSARKSGHIKHHP